jgi:glycerate-2-kinase
MAPLLRAGFCILNLEQRRFTNSYLENLPLGARLAEIMAAAVGAVDAENAVRRNLRIENDFLIVADKTFALREIERIFVVGAGKAGAAMAKAADEILGDLIDAGLVIVKDGHAEKSNYGRIEIVEAAHPVPDERAVENSRKLLSLVENSTENDLVLVLISGGGSAVSTLPAGNVELADLQFLTNELLRCGATIGEINCLRKHLTVLAGGGLAEIAFPAKICSLIISDVVGSPLDVIASGMTAPDSTTFADAWRIIEKLFEMQKPAQNDFGFRISDFGFEDCQTTNPKSEIPNPKSEGTLTSCVFPQFSEMQKPARSKGAKETLTSRVFPQFSDLPESIERHLLHGLRGEIADTPKADAEIWRSVSNFIVADNRLAANSAVEKAHEIGFDAEILTCSLEGEASAVGAMIAEIAARRAAEPREKPFLLVAGGETTVTIRGMGKGGRNQELALGAVEKLSGLENVVLATLATDGGDGTADAAGAVVDGKTLEKAFEKNLIPADFLRRNDSYNFFEPLGALLKTGATLTNVNDLLFLLITPREDFR